MIFSSLSFIFGFLPFFLALYYCVPSQNKKAGLRCRNFLYNKNTLLFLGSLIFYSIGEPSCPFLILASTLVNYLIGRGIAKCKTGQPARIFLFMLALVCDFGALLFFKYTGFFIENINLLLRTLRIDWQFYTLNLTLPLGISFYTFQTASYIIDVYRGKAEAEKSFTSLGAYICMFPQLIAGPIVLYPDISEALKKRSVSIRNIDRGLRIFIIGLGCKVILANQIGTLWNEVCTIGYESISTPLAWLGAAACAMQLYFDFCGYSVMAVGLGEMLGFRIPENFRFPYMARSVTDFWRRWHITLGAWFREYVYIPLGGNRRGRRRAMVNLLVVWLFVGFWHGAAWNFILWGLMIFVLLAVEKNLTLRFLNAKNIFARLASHLYIIIYIAISWIIFTITDFSELGVYLSKMFPFFSGAQSVSADDFFRLLGEYAPLLTAGVIFSTHYPKRLWKSFRDNAFGTAVLLVVFWYSVYLLSIGINNPFLYFRF